MISSFAALNRDEVLLLPRELTFFIFPLGGIEQHGPHLPMGTKLFEAESWARMLADSLQEKLPQWNLILMPVIPFTVDTISTALAITVRPHVVRDALVDQCDSLKKKGFQYFGAASAHFTPKQITAIEDAAKIIEKKQWIFWGQGATFIPISSANIETQEVWKSPMIQIPKDHGGEKDTAWILKLSPNFVHQSYKTLSALPKPEASIGRFVRYYRDEIDGYWGNPSEANPERFQKEAQQNTDSLASQIQTVLEKGQGKSLFRSSYRWFPLNGSFFKAYLLATLFFIVLFLWVIWGFRDVFEA